MSKKVTWVIVGLMSAALIGVVWLQMNLIFTFIRISEKKFDKDVYDALQAVVERIAEAEHSELLAFTMNGYVANFFQQQTIVNESGEVSTVQIDLAESLLPPIKSIDQAGTKTPFHKMKEIINNPCQCSRCTAERDNAYRSLMFYYDQGMNAVPLAERIKVKQLRTALKTELENRGIDIEYKYGVFASKTNSFVIADDHYVVETVQPAGILPGYKNVYTSKYKVHLFPNEMPPPGLLMIHFPSKSSFVWRSNWLNFVGAIIFTGIILFCFVYTLNVIFRQKKLSEMKNDFINNMTHEFKTPIATISLAADSITSPIIAGNSDKVARFASIIKQENIRMNSQVEKVLQMALIEKKDFSLKISDVNVHEVIGHAIENIGLQVEKRAGTAKAILEATKPIVEGDLTHISNIINNLLDNANKYSPENPEITVYTRNISGGLEVVVEDKGIGLSKEARKHIFDKFYRVHTGDLHDVKGFGLGLSYVKAMMTAHRGTIDVKSELGKGSSFILFFPFKIDSK